MLEKDLYPPVRRWLERRGCFATGIDTGVAQARIDVVGLKDVGGHLSGRAELVTIEVKRARTPFGNAIGQAHGYSVYADRCYLADARSNFTDEEVRIASHLGVGLLSITADRGGRLRVQEVLTAPLRQPLEELRLKLAEVLGYSECTICRSFFQQRDVANGSSISQYVSRGGRAGSLAKAVRDEQGYMYWLDERRNRSTDSRLLNYYRRYICPDCVWNLFHNLAESRH